jgi:hypothetical protein
MDIKYLAIEGDDAVHKKITASFPVNPDEKILNLVKKILIDSHTNNLAQV